MKNVSERALITVTDGSQSCHILVPRGGSPANVASVLLAVTPRLNRQAFNAGETAADIISAIDPKVRVQLVSTQSQGFTKADYFYFIFFSITDGHKVQVGKVAGGGIVATMFDGKLFQFTEWAEKLTGFEDLVQKVVKFKYEGGSNPGKTRVVRVEKVERDGRVVALEGYDLEKTDLKMAYRRYTSDKIAGEISVLN